MARQVLPLYLTLAAFAVSANAVPPLIATISKELSLPAWSLGAGITLQYLSFSVIAWLGGSLSERHRIPRRTMILLGLAILTPALALAPFAISSLPAILLWMCLLGLAGGSVETFASLLLADDSTSGSSKALCLSQAFYALGAFVAPQAARLSLEGLGNWQSAFLVFGGLVLAVTLFFGLLGKSQVPSAASPVAARPLIGPAAAEVDAAADRRAALRFGLIIFTYVTAELLCGSWMAYMLGEQRGLSVGTAASTMSLFWLGMVAGRVVVAFLPDRWTLRPALVASAVVVAVAALALAFSPGTSGAALCLLGFALGPIWPITVHLAAKSLRSSALAAGVIAIGGLGAAAGPLLGSLILSVGLPRLYFPLVAGLCVILLIVIMASRGIVRGSPILVPAAEGPGGA